MDMIINLNVLKIELSRMERYEPGIKLKKQ